VDKCSNLPTVNTASQKRKNKKIKKVLDKMRKIFYNNVGYENQKNFRGGVICSGGCQSAFLVLTGF